MQVLDYITDAEEDVVNEERQQVCVPSHTPRPTPTPNNSRLSSHHRTGTVLV